MNSIQQKKEKVSGVFFSNNLFIPSEDGTMVLTHIHKQTHVWMDGCERPNNQQSPLLLRTREIA
jgi:hypothetical protein